MEIKDLVAFIEEVKSLDHGKKIVENAEHPFEVGRKYFIRTVTYHMLGKVAKIVGNFLVFEEKTYSWIAESDRFMNSINEGHMKEVEPVNPVAGVNINSIVDYFEWEHDLLRTQQ